MLTLFMLWALIAYPLQVNEQHNSIVYINQATNQTWVAVFYVIATCGSLFFSGINDMVIFGGANLGILLITMAVKRYAFTSVWCCLCCGGEHHHLCLLPKKRKASSVFGTQKRFKSGASGSRDRMDAVVYRTLFILSVGSIAACP